MSEDRPKINGVEKEEAAPKIKRHPIYQIGEDAKTVEDIHLMRTLGYVPRELTDRAIARFAIQLGLEVLNMYQDLNGKFNMLLNNVNILLNTASPEQKKAIEEILEKAKESIKNESKPDTTANQATTEQSPAA